MKTRAITATTATDLRGKRPRNRRELILSAAADQFASRGYEHVTLGDVARAVAVGPSALYRHFSSKEELLTEVLLAAMRPLADVLSTTAEDPEASLEALIGMALDERGIGLLLQREARHLSGEQRALVGDAARELESSLTAVVRRTRPELRDAEVELLVWAVFATLVSPSFTELEMPRTAYVQVLSTISHRILGFAVPTAWAVGPRDSVAGSVAYGSRREAVLWRAIELFAERTYASVSVEDVAVSLGMAGPSVYAHFDSKHQILATAMTRGAAVLNMSLAGAISSSATPTQALEKLIDGYVRFALEHHRMVSLLVTEMRNLEGDARAAAMAAQAEYVAEWTRLLRLSRPELSPAHARFSVVACLMVINTAVRRSHVRRRPGAQETLVALGRAILDV